MFALSDSFLTIRSFQVLVGPSLSLVKRTSDGQHCKPSCFSLSAMIFWMAYNHQLHFMLMTFLLGKAAHASYNQKTCDKITGEVATQCDKGVFKCANQTRQSCFSPTSANTSKPI